MSVTTIAEYLLLQRDAERKEKLKRQILRDKSNPLDLPQEIINKEAFSLILAEISHLLKSSSIPPQLKLAATLRFLAVGCFQRSIGKDSDIALGRSSVSKILNEVLIVLERILCRKWIKLQLSENEYQQSKASFYNKYGLPGIIGCIDGTHVKLVKPHHNDHLYFNRKGCFSVNVMVVCDYNMYIRAIDGCHPGSSHDAFIFNMSNVREFYKSNYDRGERGHWLLGDSGYGLEPFLLTPYRNPSSRSAEHLFNLQHAKARNIVERVIGVFKSRFRCLQGTLQYSPEKVVRMVNVCAALHNMCRYYNIEDGEIDVTTSNDVAEDRLDENRETESAGGRIRDEIAQDLLRTHT